jgi:hypothetical protein
MKTSARHRFYQWFDVIWSLLLVFGITMAAIYLPLRLIRNIDQSIFSYTIATAVTVLFMLDIAYNIWVTLRTHNVANDRYVGLRMYLRKRFVIDLIAAIPLTLLANIAPPLVIMRLIKLVRLRDMMMRWQYAILEHLSALRLAFLVYWMVIVAHWAACGWISIHGAPANVAFRDYYIRSLYWAVTTLSTVGYGDVTPKTNTEIMYATAIMATGVILYGYVIGNIANILRNLDLSRQRYYEHAEKVRSFMKTRQLPVPLQRRLGEYYAYYWERQFGYDETQILASLPPGLRAEVSIFLRRDFST